MRGAHATGDDQVSKKGLETWGGEGACRQTVTLLMPGPSVSGGNSTPSPGRSAGSAGTCEAMAELRELGRSSYDVMVYLNGGAYSQAPGTHTLHACTNTRTHTHTRLRCNMY